jgi:FAD/FMN-containing dehydrogenase
MDRHGFEAAFYGHFGDGVLHCRVSFDVRTEPGLANYRRFAEEASTLGRKTLHIVELLQQRMLH